MFGLGVPEVIFILVLALLIFGPKKLPEIGRMVGRGLGEFRRASNDLQRTISAELALEDEVKSPPRIAPRVAPEGTEARSASSTSSPAPVSPAEPPSSPAEAPIPPVEPPDSRDDPASE